MAADPQFTVIVPVRNGGADLKSCIDSILAQSYPDFNLAVLDNRSDDGSSEWLASLGDSRISIDRSETLMPVEENFARALEVPKAEFMTILGHDDLLDPNYLEVMAKLIARHPNAGLYHAHFRFIHGDGSFWRDASVLPERETAAEYLAALMHLHRDTWGSGYLYRTAHYEQVGGFPRWEKLLYADDALWLKLMRDSYKATAPERCFSCRIHPVSTGASSSWRSWLQGMDNFIVFLRELAARDSKLATALASYGPQFFFDKAKEVRARALVEATRANRHLEPTAIDEIATVLGHIAPGMVSTFRADQSARRHSLVNRFLLTRIAYNTYIKLRYRA